MAQKISKETMFEAEKVAKGTQRPGQTKEQTKLISQGIAKGIAEYKKQQSKKARERDKLKKTKQKSASSVESENVEDTQELPKQSKLPWILLFISWLLFGVYLAILK